MQDFSRYCQVIPAELPSLPLTFQQLGKTKQVAIKGMLDQTPGLTSSAKRIWLYCSGLIGRDRSYAFPHHSTIAGKLGVSKKTVQRALRNLEESGWLKYEPGAGDRGNKIWLLLPVHLEEQQDQMTGTIVSDCTQSPSGFDYHRYLASREWAQRREAVRERADGKCERCQKARMQAVHHLTYERAGAELLTDLQAVCRPCHEFLSAKSDIDPLRRNSSLDL